MSDEWVDVTDQWVDVSERYIAPVTTPEAPAVQPDNSFSYRLRNNLAAAANAAMPFADEGAAALRSVLPGYQGYDEELAAIRGQEKQYSAEHPYQALLSSLLGVGATIPAIPSKVSTAGNAIARTIQAAKEGSLLGALYGYGSGEGGVINRAEESGKSAVLGGGIGALSNALLEVPRAVTTWRQGAAQLAQPETQTALEVAGDLGYLNKSPDKIRRMGEGTEQALELVTQKSQNLDEAIASQLGANAGDTATEKALGKQLRDGMSTLRESGIFEQAGDVPELVQAANRRVGVINGERAQTAETLDKLAGSNVRIGYKTPEVANALTDLNKRVSKLNLSGFADDIAEGIKTSVAQVKNDLMKRGGLKPSEAVDYMQTLNEVRRNLLREFDTANIAKSMEGNSKNLGNLEASIEAISKLQKSVANALDDVAGKLSPDLPPNYFAKLNEEHGALRALEDIGEKFQRGTFKGDAVRDPERIVQNQQRPILSNAFGGARRVGADLWDKLTHSLLDKPNDTLLNAARNQDRNARSMRVIQGLLELDRNPISQTPAAAPGWDELMKVLLQAQSGAPAISGLVGTEL